MKTCILAVRLSMTNLLSEVCSVGRSYLRAVAIVSESPDNQGEVPGFALTLAWFARGARQDARADRTVHGARAQPKGDPEKWSPGGDRSSGGPT